MIGRSDRVEPEDEDVVRLKRFDDFDMKLGDIMRGERATLGKSLLDVQRDLKIKATYINAIENADPSAFESPGFVAGYVRSYARYLNLDPEWAFETFCSEGGFTVAHGMSAAASGPAKAASRGERRGGLRDPIAEPNVSFIPTAPSSIGTIEPRAIGSLLVLVALIGGLSYGGWSVLQEVQKVQFAPVDQAPGVASNVRTLETGLDLAATETADLEPQAPSPEALDRLYRPQALDVPVLVARDGPIGALNPAETGRLAPGLPIASVQEPDRLFAPEPLAAAPAAPDEEPVVQVVEDGPPEISLLAVRPSWVRVRAADGTIVFEKILDAGERFTLPQTEEGHILRAGNAGSLYFDVGGETYGPAGDGPAVVRNVSLAEDDIRAAYVVADIESDADLKRFVNVAEAGASE